MEKYEYLLIDNNGANSISIEIKLRIGTIFEYLGSNYEVSSYGDEFIICERLCS